MLRNGLPTRCSLALATLVVALATGCGTTKWSDSPRTATEQLLVSDSVDRAISEIDFSALAEKTVYLDTRYIITALDQNYVVSTLRQHMLASGIIIKDKPDEATYVVEVRTGSLGTNRQDLLFGVPATNLPTAGLLPVGSAAIPEIALMKRTNQQAVCKIAVFAYDRMSGRPVWQSGNRKVASRAKDIWLMGAGPFQKGTIYDGTAFAGEKLSVPLVKGKAPLPSASVGVEKVFVPTGPPAQQYVENGGKTDVQSAGYTTAGNPPATGTPPAQLPPSGQAQPAAAAPAAPAAKPDAAKPDAAKPDAPKPDTPKAEPPKAAYTPPPAAAPAAPPPVPLPGPQGNLTQQAMFPTTANPAASTAGAIQTINIAREFLDRQKD